MLCGVDEFVCAEGCEAFPMFSCGISAGCRSVAVVLSLAPAFVVDVGGCVRGICCSDVVSSGIAVDVLSAGEDERASCPPTGFCGVGCAVPSCTAVGCGICCSGAVSLGIVVDVFGAACGVFSVPRGIRS